MGLFDFWKKPKGKSGMTHATTMNGSVPFFSSFGESVYASDIVVQSIRCKANEFKKLDPQHIRTAEGKQQTITGSSVAKVLKRPNPYMTTADFLEKITILLELNKNVFIYPTYYMTKGGEKYFTGLYPLKPSAVEYLQDSKGVLFIHLQFANGFDTTLPAADVIHWRKDYGVNDYFGGGAFGGDDNTGLLKMLQRYDQLTQSIAKALKCSCQINGIVHYNTYMDDDAKKAEREKFEQALQNNESGVLFTDNKMEYTHLPRDVKLVDAETLKFFYDAILRANGTSLAILNGDYTKQQKEAYYEHALEADIISLGQAMSRGLFSDREASFGNEVIFYPNDIQFMTMENKIAYMQVAVPAGAMSINQILKMGGFPPVEGGDDIRPRGFNSLDGAKQTDDTGDDNTPTTE
jgi:HK97 family phage portal protein